MATRPLVRAPGWAELVDWHVDRASDTPLFRQVYLQIRAAILAGRLARGTRLPSTRALAARLRVARASVVSAYEQLLAEGYLSGRTGSGTYVASDVPEPIERRAPPRAGRAARPSHTSPRLKALEEAVTSALESDPRPFTTGRCSVDARTAQAWRTLSHRALRTLDPVHLGYSDARGIVALRAAICEYLRAARAVRCEPEQVIVTSGTQHAIDLAIRVLLDRGDRVWVEDPGYPTTRAALVTAGVTTCPVPVDGQGLDVAAGVRSAPRARAAFVTPSHQFPLGVVLSMGRRLALLAWARESGAWIVEDDYDSEFRYAGRPLASLQGLDDGERTLYVGTFNKLLFPGLRIGYAVVPRPLVRAFVNARALVDRHPPSLGQVVVADFMRQGYFAGHVRRVRILAREQRDALVTTLARRAGGALTVEAPAQGKHLVAYLEPGVSDVAVARAALLQGVNTRAISPMYRAAPARQGLMLGFTGYSREAIVAAAGRLAGVVRGPLSASRTGGRTASGRSAGSGTARR